MRTVHAADVVITMLGDVLAHAGVLVVDGVVAAIGTDFPGERVRQWPGVLTPGLVDPAARLATDQPSARVQAHELLKTGTTAIGDPAAPSVGLQGPGSSPPVEVAGDLLLQRTLGNALRIGRPDLGRLEVGGRADLAVFAVPLEDLLRDGPTACVATVLGGRLVHRR